MSNYLIFGATSRGANLYDFIQKQNPFPQIINPQVVVKRGGSINQIHNDITVKINTVGQEHVRCIIYIAGLCDMTKKVSHDFGTEICYFREKSNVCHIIQEYQQIQRELQATNIPVMFSSIAPATIGKYIEFNLYKYDTRKQSYRLFKSLYTDTDIEMQQRNLVNDIRLIHDQIQALNVSNGMPNIRLDKPLQKTKIFNKGSKSKKIFKFRYNDLYDGVHADDFLYQWWYSCMCTTALHFLHNQHKQI